MARELHFQRNDVAPLLLAEELAAVAGDALETISVDESGVTVRVREDADKVLDADIAQIVAAHRAGKSADERREEQMEAAKDAARQIDFDAIVAQIERADAEAQREGLLALANAVRQLAAAQGLVAETEAKSERAATSARAAKRG